MKALRLNPQNHDIELRQTDWSAADVAGERSVATCDVKIGDAIKGHAVLVSAEALKIGDWFTRLGKTLAAADKKAKAKKPE